MKHFNRKFIVMFSGVLIGLLAPVSQAKEMTADEIVYQSEERYDGKTQISEISMLLIDAAGNKRLRKMKSFRRDFGNSLKDQKSIYFFEYPEDIKDTSYMNFDWEAEHRDDDSWLYLPAIKKVKRLAASDKSDAFLGSDFSYTDIKTANRHYWDFSFVKQSEIVDGHDCWVLEGVPKKGGAEKAKKETGYDKLHVWIRKDNYVRVQGKFWVVKGKKIKYFKASDIENMNGIWVAKSNQMSTTKNGRTEHTTVLKTTNIHYDREIEDTFFTTQKMNRGS